MSQSGDRAQDLAPTLLECAMQTLLEPALQLHGEFRSRVTPLQAGVILFLLRHPNTTRPDAEQRRREGGNIFHDEISG